MCNVSPNSLQFLTIDVVAQNYQTLCHEVQEEVKFGCECVVFSKLVFKDGLFLPASISERLLQRMVNVQHNTISSDILRLFTDPQVCPLRRFCVGNVLRNEKDSHLEFMLRMVLIKQELIELDTSPFVDEYHTDLSDFKISVSLKHLILSPADSVSMAFILTFDNLHQLDISNSKSIGDKELALFAFHLINLASLDISLSNVKTVEAFGALRNKLKILNLHGTPFICELENLLGLLQFSNLEFLDISQHRGGSKPGIFSQFLTGSAELQYLVSLDISGAGKIDNEALKAFMQSHPKFRFLGLLHVEQTVYPAECIPEDVEVTGDESLKQVLTCLKYYRKRAPFLIEALRKLYGFSLQNNLKDDVERRKIIIKLLLDLMAAYMDNEQSDVHMAASACLYGYTTCDRSKGPNTLHVSLLSEMVSVIIQVLIKFPKDILIHKNCLLTMYNSYILGNVTFDKFLLVKLMLRALSLLLDDNLDAIALEICAFLSSMISMEQTLMLGTRENIEILLNIVERQVVGNNLPNFLFRCALRVLWNFTDEAPKTCQLLVDLNGLSLISRALQTFGQESEVSMKILGILNNLAEVVPIRPLLLTDDLIPLLRGFLGSSYQIDVSYFAAGIICNLANDWPAELQLTCDTRSDLLSLVCSTVNQWKTPNKPLVGYRTFKPFIPLLCSCLPDVQLWAVWAIHHVCYHNRLRYGKICKDEGILKQLKDLSSCPETRSDVKSLSMKTANAIEHNSARLTT